MLVIVCAVVVGGLEVSIILIGKKYVDYFRKRQVDAISFYVGLFMLAMIVFMADVIKSILSINLSAVDFGIFIGYTVVRYIIQEEKVDVEKSLVTWIGITLGSEVFIMATVHFFGMIGLIAVQIGVQCLIVRSEIKPICLVEKY